MKKILLLILLFVTCSEWALAQFEGKRFLSGTAGIGFNTSNPDEGKSTNDYLYNVNLGIGKFKTETRASGWNLNSSLTGGTQYVTMNNAPVKIDGIRGFSLGAGHFWEFYKHFNANFGIFGGPSVNVDYSYEKEKRFTGSEAFDDKSNSVTASLSISAGAYYKLSERWWLLGSLGFSQPLGVSYKFTNTTAMDGDPQEQTTQTFTYGFSPNITFPSVSLGLRYFFKD